MATDFVPLTDVPRKIKELTGQDDVPSYNVLKLWGYDAKIPVVRVNGRLGIEKRDLPEIAARLGLSVPSELAA
ncbi:MAG: hypothetical protein JO110_04585 [Acetobacteraceae bacterium]|nr:hypothetical protein [Acetobacteraceae bacterium]